MVELLLRAFSAGSIKPESLTHCYEDVSNSPIYSFGLVEVKNVGFARGFEGDVLYSLAESLLFHLALKVMTEQFFFLCSSRINMNPVANQQMFKCTFLFTHAVYLKHVSNQILVFHFL